MYIYPNNVKCGIKNICSLRRRGWHVIVIGGYGMSDPQKVLRKTERFKYET